MIGRTRRWLLHGFALLAAGLWGRAFAFGAERHNVSVREGVRLTECPSAAIVGAAYLRAFPGDSSPSAWLCLDAEGREYRPDWDRFAGKPEALEQIQRDFEIGEVVTIEGWLLSRTELRLCVWAWRMRRERRGCRD